MLKIIMFTTLFFVSTLKFYAQTTDVGYYQAESVMGMQIELLSDSSFNLYWKFCEPPVHDMVSFPVNSWNSNEDTIFLRGLNNISRDSILIKHSPHIISNPRTYQRFIKTKQFYPNGSLKTLLYSAVLNEEDSIIGGDFQHFYNNGLGKHFYSLKNGKLDGVEEKYFPYSIEDIKDEDKKELHEGDKSLLYLLTIIYSNVKFIGNWVDGQKDGKWTYYREDGTVSKTEYWRKGKPVKPWRHKLRFKS